MFPFPEKVGDVARLFIVDVPALRVKFTAVDATVNPIVFSVTVDEPSVNVVDGPANI